VVFGELLGGMLTRGGERFHEERQRQNKLDDWRTAQHLNYLTDFMSKNWDNLQADQQQALLGDYAKLTKQKPQDVMNLTTAAKAIHKIIPPQYASPETLGPTQRTGPVAVTPSAEPAVRGVAAPASIQIGQLPQPGEILSPSIMAPTTGHTASFGRDMTAGQMVEQRKAEQAQQLRQQKVAEIMASSMDDDDKALAIRALHIPGAVLAAQERKVSGAPNVGLSTQALISKDGKHRITVQTMRSGGYMLASGALTDPITKQTIYPGQPIPPHVAADLERSYVFAPQAYVNQQGSLDVLNKTELGRQMNQQNQITGQVPDIRVAETRTPVTSSTGQVTGTVGSRSGSVVPISGTGAGGSAAPLYKGAISEGAQAARGQIQIFQDSLNKIGPLVEKHKDVVGRVSGNIEKVKAWAGWSKEEVDDLIGELNTVKNTYIYMVSGKQINEAEQARLSAVMPDIGLPPNRLKNNLARFKRIVDTMARVREMGRPEGATSAELSAADREVGGGSPSTQGGGTTGGSMAPKIGDHREFPNGNIGVWDGKGWKKVNR
jgi:hypothetical protein